MNVLLITQRVDDNHDVLGFMTDWIATLAEKVDSLAVLTGYAGRYTLPDNVTVYSYGKEKKYSKPQRVLSFQYQCRKIASTEAVDVVFSHMIPKYVLASWPWFGTQGIPYIQWYAHSSVTWDLKLAHRLVDCVVTSTEQGFRLNSNKVEVVGQGIDTDRFCPDNDEANRTRLLGVGRVDPVKNFSVLIDAVNELVERGHEVSLRIVGDSSNEIHMDRMEKRVQQVGLSDRIEFVGTVPNKDIVEEYRRAGLFLNASRTGSLDKTEIEAPACGTPTISCNDSYREFVRSEGLDPELLVFPPGDATALADRVERVLELDDDSFDGLRARSRQAVVENHDVDALMRNVSELCESLVAGTSRT